VNPLTWSDWILFLSLTFDPKFFITSTKTKQNKTNKQKRKLSNIQSICTFENQKKNKEIKKYKPEDGVYSLVELMTFLFTHPTNDIQNYAFLHHSQEFFSVIFLSPWLLSCSHGTINFFITSQLFPSFSDVNNNDEWESTLTLTSSAGSKWYVWVSRPSAHGVLFFGTLRLQFFSFPFHQDCFPFDVSRFSDTLLLALSHIENKTHQQHLSAVPNIFYQQEQEKRQKKIKGRMDSFQ